MQTLWQWIRSHKWFISSFWFCPLRALCHHICKNQLLCMLGHGGWFTVPLVGMSYSSVSSSDRGSRESADLQRAFILAVIQPEKGRERERGPGMLSSMLPAIQTHTLMLIKPKFHISALFSPIKTVHTYTYSICVCQTEQQEKPVQECSQSVSHAVGPRNLKVVCSRWKN